MQSLWGSLLKKLWHLRSAAISAVDLYNLRTILSWDELQIDGLAMSPKGTRLGCHRMKLKWGPSPKWPIWWYLTSQWIAACPNFIGTNPKNEVSSLHLHHENGTRMAWDDSAAAVGWCGWWSPVTWDAHCQKPGSPEGSHQDSKSRCPFPIHALHICDA